MYNAEQKERYLAYCGQDKRVRSLFQHVEKYEKKENKDICLFHTDEVLDILVTMSKSTAASERSRLIRYFEWCRASQYCKVNWLDKRMCPLDKFMAAMEAVEDKYYLSHDKYLKYVEVLRSSADGDYDLPIFMCMYEGVKDYVNFAYLTTEDVERKKRRLCLHNSGEIVISAELADALLQAGKVEVLNNTAQKSRLTFEFRKNAVWKSSKDIGEAGQITKFRRRFGKIKQLLGDERLSISNISSSGIFYYIVSRTREDGIDILEDLQNSSLNRNQLNLKYQKYFLEKKLALNFWEFKYRFQDYFRYIQNL